MEETTQLDDEETARIDDGLSLETAPYLPVTVRDVKTGASKVYQVEGDIDPILRVKIVKWFAQWRAWRDYEMADPTPKKAVPEPDYVTLYNMTARVLEVPVAEAAAMKATNCVKILDFLLARWIERIPTEITSD